MKKTQCTVLLGTAVLLGVLRAADLFLFTEADTGFVSLGTAWQRYAVMGVFALVLMFFPYDKRDDSIKTTEINMPVVRISFAAAGVLSAISGILAAVYSVTQLIAPTTMFGMENMGSGLILFAFALRIILSLGMMSFGAWLLMLYERKEPLSPQQGILRTLGFCSMTGFFSLTILRYAEMPASAHRILSVLPIFSALAALICTGKLLGTLCVSCTAQYRRSMQSACIFTFFICTCIGLPQLVWQLIYSDITVMNAFIAEALAVYGIGAAAVAYINEN